MKAPRYYEERYWERASMRCWMPVFHEPVIPFGVPARALAVGIPFADLVRDVRREGNRVIFSYTEDD